MTLPAREAGAGTSTVLPAVASTACRARLDGPSSRGRLLGASHRAVWMSIDDDVIVLAAADGVRLPNGMALGVESTERPFEGMAPGDAAVVGEGMLHLPGLTARAARWWDPRPALAASTSAVVRERSAAARLRVDPVDDRGLGRALAGGDAPGVVAAAEALLGLGLGLTPQGDDVLAGALAALRLMGGALGRSRPGALVDEVAPAVLSAAAGHTTALSASLLRHACRGNVADPVAGFLHVLTGRGDLDTATETLLAVGHSSGASLAAGILCGAEAACGEETM